MLTTYSQRRHAKQPHRRCSGSPMGITCRQIPVLDMFNAIGAGFPIMLDPCQLQREILVLRKKAHAYSCRLFQLLLTVLYTHTISSSKKESTRGKGQTAHDLEEGLKRGLLSRKSMTQEERMLAAI
eukprot:1161931-Pelagomonas_calceolata.AAC.3